MIGEVLGVVVGIGVIGAHGAGACGAIGTCSGCTGDGGTTGVGAIGATGVGAVAPAQVVVVDRFCDAVPHPILFACSFARRFASELISVLGVVGILWFVY